MTPYRSVHAPDHPLAGRNGKTTEHRVALYAKIGPGPHPCHWCQAPLNWLPGRSTRKGALVVDHLDDDGRHNAPENLVPSCHGCNVMRALPDRPVKDAELFVIRNGYRRRAVGRTCGQCGRSFLIPIDQLRPGKGEWCSRRCTQLGAFKGKFRPAERALTDDQVRHIRALLAEGALSQPKIAGLLGLKRHHVDSIARGVSYRHVT